MWAWDDLLAQASANQLKNYEGDPLNTTLINGQAAQFEYDQSGNVTGFNLYGTEEHPGYNAMLTPTADGKVATQWYKEDNSTPWGALMMLAGPLLAITGVTGAAASTTTAATSTTGGNVGIFDSLFSDGVSDWVSAGDMDLATVDMAGEAVTDTVLSGSQAAVDEYANETAKLLQQTVNEDYWNANLDPAVHSIDLSGIDSALADPEYANESNKFLRQEATTDYWQQNMAVPTVDLNPPTLPRLPSIPGGGTKGPRVPTIRTTGNTATNQGPSVIRTILETLTGGTRSTGTGGIYPTGTVIRPGQQQAMWPWQQQMPRQAVPGQNPLSQMVGGGNNVFMWLGMAFIAGLALKGK